MKGILNSDYVKAVEAEAKNPIYHTINAISFSLGSRNPLSIERITPNGLIFIKGTDDTGFTHICHRHSGTSGEDFWDNFYDNEGQIVEKYDNYGRSKYRLDNPSQFHPHSIPIFDYVSIADQVYSSGQPKIDKNKHKDLFDVYEGLAVCLNKAEIQYRLVLYKDSKIVHTLYPLSKKFNKQERIVVHFARQSPRSKIRLLRNDFQIEIPYIDEHKIERFVIIIRDNPFNINQENWYIQANAFDGCPLATQYITQRIKDMDIRSEQYLWRLDNIDLSLFEEMMKKMDRLIIPSKPN